MIANADDSPLRIGDTFLEKYEIRALIGRGGYAWVYHGYDPFMGEDAAIKIIHKRGGVTKEVMMRGRTEARLLKKLQHPNIVELIDAGIREGFLYIVMELLHGRSLYDALGDNGRLEPEIALPLFAQIADGVGIAHDLGAIHRDLKPANVFVTPGNIPKVLDFGIAKVVDADALTTRKDGVLGTMAYISPEQLNGVRATPQSDIYSLGIALYQALLRHPCHAEIEQGNMQAIGWFHTMKEPPLLDTLDPAIPHDVALLVNRAVAKIPGQRFQTMKSFAEQIRGCEMRYRTEAARAGRRLGNRDISVAHSRGHERASHPNPAGPNPAAAPNYAAPNPVAGPNYAAPDPAASPQANAMPAPAMIPRTIYGHAPPAPVGPPPYAYASPDAPDDTGTRAREAAEYPPPAAVAVGMAPSAYPPASQPTWRPSDPPARPSGPDPIQARNTPSPAVPSSDLIHPNAIPVRSLQRDGDSATQHAPNAYPAASYPPAERPRASAAPAPSPYAPAAYAPDAYSPAPDAYSPAPYARPSAAPSARPSSPSAPPAGSAAPAAPASPNASPSAAFQTRRVVLAAALVGLLIGIPLVIFVSFRMRASAPTDASASAITIESVSAPPPTATTVSAPPPAQPAAPNPAPAGSIAIPATAVVSPAPRTAARPTPPSASGSLATPPPLPPATAAPSPASTAAPAAKRPVDKMEEHLRRLEQDLGKGAPAQ